MHQVLDVLPSDLTAVGYAAQNLDKRYPPPFTRWERSAYGRLAGVYPCSRQAASVVRGRGYQGEIAVLPLGADPNIFRTGTQRHGDEIFQLVLAGRMVPEKGVRDAIKVLAEVRRYRRARLVLAGSGPELDRAADYGDEFGVSDSIEVRRWLGENELAELLRSSHLVLAPSHATRRWVEQFGRTVVEAQACGAVVAGYASGTIPEVAAGAAWLSAEGDEIGLARACVRLASDDAYWSRLRERGLRLAPSRSWAEVAEAQLALYERAIDAGPQEPTPPDWRSRVVAARSFGPAARTGDGQSRPIALPILRDWPSLSGLVNAHAAWRGRRAGSHHRIRESPES